MCHMRMVAGQRSAYCDSTPRSRQPGMYKGEITMAKLKAPEPPVNEGTLSTCALVMTGKEKLPKGAVLAEKADFNLLYVNFEHTPRMIRIESKAANRVHVQVYNELSREWIKTTVPMNYPLHTQVDALPTTHRPNVGQQVRVKETSSGAGPRTIKSNGNNSVTGCKSGSIGDLIGHV